MKIFSGTSNIPLAVDIARHLKLSLGRAIVGSFSDGEVRVEIQDDVRGEDVFVIQSTSAPASDHLMELLAMIDALKRASARHITAVIPYFGYARQDRRPRGSRSPMTAKLVAQMIGVAGADRVVTMDLHADQIQGFFDVPIDNIYASPVLLGDIWKGGYEDLTVVSPDVGGVVRARALAVRLGDAGMAIIDKRRPHPNESEVMHIIGDVENKNCIIVDDMVDTAGTLCEAANALKERGAARVKAYCTHPVLSGLAVFKIEDSELDELVVTDTIPLSMKACVSPKIRQVSVVNLLAETIYRLDNHQSVSSLFID